MNINEYLESTRKVLSFDSLPGHEFLSVRPRIVCKDGFTVSVQTSDTHYCRPRTIYGPYSKVEVGYPSSRPPREWQEYYDGDWQEVGWRGYIKRLLKDPHTLWYAFKQGFGVCGWRYFKSLTSLADNACEGVYGYVPIELVDELIEAHGGVEAWNEREKEEA